MLFTTATDMNPVSDNAQLNWQDNGTPISNRFGDVYFSRDDGIAESRYVFIDHNNLPQRWQSLGPNQAFFVAETGFGTGLNFLLTCQLWLETSKPGQRLIYLSTECFPLRCDDLERAHSFWPELSTVAATLRASYPPALTGVHAIELHGGRVLLLLLIGDALTQLKAWLECDYPDFAPLRGACVDAWFLDGFAPAKNPEMWQPALYETMARLSKPGTSLATFTAAGDVRRGLMAAGFSMRKTAGYGQKRDMLVGTYFGLPHAPLLPTEAKPRSYGYDAPWYKRTASPLEQRQISIIGAGLAGAISAWQLANRGWNVTVYDPNEPGTGASGNPQGLLYTKLSGTDSALSRFSWQSYLYAIRFYRDLFAQEVLIPGQDGELSGLLQLGYDDSERILQDQLRTHYAQLPELVQFIDAPAASALAGMPLDYPALYFPSAGWLHPASVCRTLLKHPAIQVRTRAVTRLTRTLSDWSLTLDDHSSHESPVVLIANSFNARQFAQIGDPGTRRIRGQISLLPVSRSQPRIAVCHDGYLAPPMQGQLCFGATFDLTGQDPLTTLTDHQENLAKLHRILPGLTEVAGAMPIDCQGRAAFRCASNDYLPLVGAVADEPAMRQSYEALRHNRRAHLPWPGTYLPGLYLSIGHGSRGLTSIPLSSRLLCALLHNEPLPVDRLTLKALAPARQIIRRLIRNRSQEE